MIGLVFEPMTVAEVGRCSSCGQPNGSRRRVIAVSVGEDTFYACVPCIEGALQQARRMLVAELRYALPT